MPFPPSLDQTDRFGLFKVARRMRGFRKARRGVAAVEFALIAPFMISLWLGSYELSLAVSADRKVSNAASVLADLITQQPTVTTGELDAIMEATQGIMMPFDSDELSIQLAGVRIDDDKETEILWSYASEGTTPAEPGEEYAIPTGLLVEDSFLVVAELTFQHESPMTQVLDLKTPLTDAFYLRPRRSQEVECVDCDS